MTEDPVLSDEDREKAVDAVVSHMVATRALVSALQAHEAALLAAAMAIVGAGRGGDSELQVRSLAAELGAALRVSDRSVQRQLSDALTLTERFPATFEALAAGRISRAHASVIVDAGCHLPDAESRSAFEASVLPYAETESATRLRPVARLRAERISSSSAQERHDRARKRRGVRVFDLDDGMSELVAVLPAVLAHGAFDRLTQLAHEVRAAAVEGPGGDEPAGSSEAGRAASAAATAGGAAATAEIAEAAARSTDELRADLLADLVLAGSPTAHDVPTGLAAIRGIVQVTVPALTLMGATDDAVELTGHAPVDPVTARRLAGHAPGWDRILTHPVSGAVLAVDRYRPGEDIKRALRVRDRHCRFVGCRQPVWRCDLDHTRDAARGGRTTVCNLAHLCRRHHVMKHHSAWRVIQLPDGVLEWTSPTGRVYRDVPVITVAFAPTLDPPPFS